MVVLGLTYIITIFLLVYELFFGEVDWKEILAVMFTALVGLIPSFCYRSLPQSDDSTVNYAALIHAVIGDLSLIFIGILHGEQHTFAYLCAGIFMVVSTAAAHLAFVKPWQKEVECVKENTDKANIYTRRTGIVALVSTSVFATSSFMVANTSFDNVILFAITQVGVLLIHSLGYYDIK